MSSSSKAPRRRAGPKLPITSTLLLGFGGLVAVAVASVLLISIQVARDNTDELLRQTATQRLAAAVARIDRADDPRIETLLRGSLGAAPQISGLAFVRSDLSTVRARRDRSLDRDRIDIISGSMARQSYAQELIEAAKRVKGVGWNDVFYVPELHASFISAMAPVRRDGRFAGAVLAAVPVSELSRLIAGNDPCRPRAADGASAQTMFILNAGDGVVAHPFLACGTFSPTPDRFLPQRQELGDPVLRALWAPQEKGLLPDLSTRLGGGSNWTRRIVADGDTYVVLLHLVTTFSPQPWTVGIYFKTAEMSEPVRRLRLAFAVGVLILAGALVLAMMLGRGLARPIRRLAAAAEAVSSFDFSGARRMGRSPLRELNTAGEAWDSMLAALRWFETYVPKALVSRLLQLSQDSELGAEEREVTVMFTDIAGFSRIAHGRTPAALAAFINRHFALIGRHVEAGQGTIDKYIGDSVMAFWGAPVPDPDHAEHAASAALAIAETLAADNCRRARKGLKPVRMRIGLSSGPVMVGNVGAPGRVNYTLLGDTVNAAQRLEQLGKEFHDDKADCIVLAGASTVQHLPPDIPRRPLGEQTLRGMGTFEVYRLG